MKENKLRNWLQNHRKLVRTGVVAAAFLLTLGIAQALFQVKINGVIVATDEGAGDTLPGLPGAIAVAPGLYGGWLVTVQSDLSKPITNGDTGELFVTTTATHVSGSTGLMIEVTDTDYFVPGDSPPNWNYTSAASTTNLGLGSVVAVDGVLNLSNTAFASTGVVLSHSFFGTSPASAGADTKSTVLAGVTPYSLTSNVALNAGIGDTVGYQHTLTVNAVPEASSLAMLLPGLAPLGLALRRRRILKA